MTYKHLTSDPIDLSNMLSLAHHPAAGGIVLFSGEVRNHHKGKDVINISYEAFEEMAESMIAALIQDAVSKYELQYAQAIHRLGTVGITESAVAIITAHVHRKNAYEANQYIIDRIKAEVPIWKKENYSDGSYYWGAQ
ncbi:MAG TPA: molybdenum cofactor biosynthesis protein MoaE [Cytophagales bacterium]|nr:molybdenum cofactor biosynthesis protein MoaE [Cytophagales bacterium]